MSQPPAPSERTPLLSSGSTSKLGPLSLVRSASDSSASSATLTDTPNHSPAHEDGPPASQVSPRAFRRLTLTAFLLSCSFAYTASTLYISFRDMACEIYWEDKLPYDGAGDRCSNRTIEAMSANEISHMIVLTTTSALMNLLWTGWVTRKFGVKCAMVMQTTVPTFRNLCQQYAVYTGGWTGIRLLQWTQLITTFGGGAGYMLTANTYTAELVTPEQRTASFGVIQGCAMLGQSLAFTLGGMTTDYVGKLACFRVTWCLLLASSAMSFCALPYIPPASQRKQPKLDDNDEQPAAAAAGRNWLAFAAPLRVFVPKPIEGSGGGRYYGLTLLGTGIFGGVLATRFVPTMLQLHATNEYGFGAADNGYLMSLIALSQAFFLTLVFPRIIAQGRRLYARSEAHGTLKLSPEQVEHLAERDGHIPAPEAPQVEGQGRDSALPMAPVERGEGSAFDLAFVRGSMLLDGVLTGCTGVFASQGWHMYLAAGILPFASGTAPAGKGVVMELVAPSQRGDALQAIALVETLAGIITVSAFGALFSYLSEIGRPETVFLYNAALAMLSACFLLLVRFPKKTGPSAAQAV